MPISFMRLHVYVIALLILFTPACKSSALTLHAARWHRMEGGMEDEGETWRGLSIYKLLILTHQFLLSTLVSAPYLSFTTRFLLVRDALLSLQVCWQRNG